MYDLFYGPAASLARDHESRSRKQEAAYCQLSRSVGGDGACAPNLPRQLRLQSCATGLALTRVKSQAIYTSLTPIVDNCCSGMPGTSLSRHYPNRQQHCDVFITQIKDRQAFEIPSGAPDQVAGRCGSIPGWTTPVMAPGGLSSPGRQSRRWDLRTLCGSNSHQSYVQLELKTKLPPCNCLQ